MEDVMSSFDLEQLVLSTGIVSMFQNGNFLVCLTDNGQEFRQSIPAGKILNKDEKGVWVLEEMNIRG